MVSGIEKWGHSRVTPSSYATRKKQMIGFSIKWAMGMYQGGLFPPPLLLFPFNGRGRDKLGCWSQNILKGSLLDQAQRGPSKPSILSSPPWEANQQQEKKRQILLQVSRQTLIQRYSSVFGLENFLLGQSWEIFGKGEQKCLKLLIQLISSNSLSPPFASAMYKTNPISIGPIAQTQPCSLAK